MDDEVRRSMARIGDATDRLLASAARLTDAGAGEPSPLPGWTRGHVLTHIARNGDGLGNLLRGPYRRQDPHVREPGGAPGRHRGGRRALRGRPHRRRAGHRHLLAARRPACPARPGRPRSRCWSAPPCPRAACWTGGCGRWRSTTSTWPRVTGRADWPAEFVADRLPEIAGRSRAGRTRRRACSSPTARIRRGAQGRTAARRRSAVHGPAATLLAWLTGRDDGSGLRVSATGPPCRCCPRGGRRPATRIRCAKELGCSAPSRQERRRNRGIHRGRDRWRRAGHP